MEHMQAAFRASGAVDKITVLKEHTMVYLKQPVTEARFASAATRFGFTIKRAPQHKVIELLGPKKKRLKNMRIVLVDEDMQNERGEKVMGAIAIQAMSQIVPDELRSNLVRLVSGLKPTNLSVVKR